MSNNTWYEENRRRDNKNSTRRTNHTNNSYSVHGLGQRKKKHDSVNLPTGGFCYEKPYYKELTFTRHGITYNFSFEICWENDYRVFDDGNSFSGYSYIIYVLDSPYKDWVLQNMGPDLPIHFYSLPVGHESICWNTPISDFSSANAVMFAWANRYVDILEPYLRSNRSSGNQRYVSLPDGAFCSKMTLSFTDEVMDQIHKTIGQVKPEQGGILGTSDGETVDAFVLDATAKTSNSTYNPNTKAMEEIINGRWKMEGISFCGYVHSHPKCSQQLSSPDIELAKKTISANGLENLVMPIVNSSADGVFKFHSFLVEKDGSVLACQTKIVDTKPTCTDNIPVSKERYEEILKQLTEVKDQAKPIEPTNPIFNRVSSVLPLDYLKDCTVIGIGCGGGREVYQDLARLGVGHFILMDGDKSDESNIATQGAFIDEVGVYKTEAIKAFIARVNPKAEVISIPKMLDETLDDKWVEDNLLAGKSTSNTLLCAFTDSFEAQARLNAIALKYSLPFLAAQNHELGLISEMVYYYPGVTKHSPQALLKSRYDAHLQGVKSNVTSTGCPTFNSVRKNALCEKVACGLLLYANNPYGRFSRFIRKYSDQNLILIRQELLDQQINILSDNFAGDDSNYLFDDPVFLDCQVEEFVTPKEITDTRDIYQGLTKPKSSKEERKS